MEIFQISGTTPSDSSQNFGPENTKIGNWYFQKLFTVCWGNVPTGAKFNFPVTSPLAVRALRTCDI